MTDIATHQENPRCWMILNLMRFFFFACNDMICMYMIYSLVETFITIGEQ